MLNASLPWHQGKAIVKPPSIHTMGYRLPVEGIQNCIGAQEIRRREDRFCTFGQTMSQVCGRALSGFETHYSVSPVGSVPPAA